MSWEPMHKARAGAIARRLERIQDKIDDAWMLDSYEHAVQGVLIPAFDRISEKMAEAFESGLNVDDVLYEAEELVRETELFVDEMIARRTSQ